MKPMLQSKDASTSLSVDWALMPRADSSDASNGVDVRVHRIRAIDEIVPPSVIVAAMTDAEKVEAVRLLFGMDFSAPVRLNAEEYERNLAEIEQGRPGQKMMFTCPHCGHKARVRTSRPLSALTTQVYAHCLNIACGHTFRAHVEIVATISPSACPDLAVAAQLEKQTRATTSTLDGNAAHRPGK